MTTETTALAHPLSPAVRTPQRVIALVNGKGGVGKTSCTANLSGLYGLAGYHVLVVELDPQGNCARDFGLPVEEYESIKDLIDSNGEQHAASLMLKSDSAKPPLYENVRPGVDLIAGGGALQRIYNYFAVNNKDKLDEAIQREILGLGKTYDLILIDAPPIDLTALDAVLRVAGTIVIPVRADEGSIDGLSIIADLFGPALAANPALRLGGVVRFGVGSSATRISKNVRDTIDEILGGAAPIFDAVIRHSDAAAYETRRHGLLAHELESASSAEGRSILAALRSGVKLGSDEIGTGAKTSKGLAEDYENLSAEILVRVNELENS